jgi:MFS superfamily sulfate permease-like transporter
MSLPATSDPAVAGLQETAHGLNRFLPILTWLPQYRRAWLPLDVVAGVTTWALLVPEAMAYAGIAGVPVQYGLYAVPLALVGYAVFGSSRELFVGPSAGIATLSAAAVGEVAVAGKDPSLYIALTGVLSLTVGAIFVVGGLARMGFIANFFAKPVLEGFIIGLGLFMIVGQIPIFTDDRRHRLREADALPKSVVLDFEAVGEVDVTGADALRAVHETLSGLGIGLVIARANSSVRLALRRYDVLDAIGADNFAPTVHEAVERAEYHP